ncbi:Fasciclin-1 [Schistosoma japonicum]|nr:Fasciclin-1 [Schistosoma japonicum]
MITTDKNLWQVIISYSNVSKFADFIREIGLQTLLEKPGCLGDDECLTIIAPTNDAIDLIANDLAWYSLGDFQKHSFIHSHIIQRGITTDQSSIRVTTRDWTKLNRQMNFIDIGFGTDIMASNGMIHIVNQVLYTSHISLPFMDFLDKQGNLGISKELWYLLLQEPKYTPYPAQNIYSTVFVVSNSGWNSVPTVHMNRLRKNITLLASILAYHYCPNQLIYREWISVKPYLNIYTGFPNRPQLANLDIRKTYYVPTANYAFTRERLRLDITSKNSDQEGSFTYQGEKCQISSVNGPYQFTNGFLYSIDKILYTKSDLNATLCSVSACG